MFIAGVMTALWVGWYVGVLVFLCLIWQELRLIRTR